MKESSEENYKHIFTGSVKGFSDELKQFLEFQEKYLIKKNIHEYILDLNKRGGNVIDCLIFFGLNLKGYRFQNENEMNDLIRKKGRAEIGQHYKTFFIEEKPFLRIDYQSDMNLEDISNIKAELTIKYEFL